MWSYYVGNHIILLLALTLTTDEKAKAWTSESVIVPGLASCNGQSERPPPVLPEGSVLLAMILRACHKTGEKGEVGGKQLTCEMIHM